MAFQVDAAFLRVMLPRFGVRLDNGGPLDTLLTEFIASVHSRCVSPQDIELTAVDTILTAKRDELGV